MKRVSKFAWVAFFGTASAAQAEPITYTIDGSHSDVAFSVKHMMISNTRGEFGKVSGTIVIDEKDQAKSAIEATIDVASVDTREPKRDEHLRSPDFFDVKKYPTMVFKSKSVKKVGAKKLAVAGDLTIRGVTKPVKFDATITPELKDPFGNFRRGAEATLKLNRKDFGLVWNKSMDSGGVVVGDEVVVNLNIEAMKKADATAAAPAPATPVAPQAAQPQTAAKK